MRVLYNVSSLRAPNLSSVHLAPLHGNGTVYGYPVDSCVYAWLPSGFSILISLLFSAFTVRYFWKKNDWDVFSAVVCTAGFWFALIDASLLPTDAFLISFMKNPNGTFKIWADNNTISDVASIINDTYYVFCCIFILYAFVLLPLVYFSFEAKTEVRSQLVFRLFYSLRYTVIFFLCAFILIMVGAFIPYRHCCTHNSTDENNTAWEKLGEFFDDVSRSRVEDALEFIINILTVIGMIILLTYTSYGFSSFPIGTLRGWNSIRAERSAINAKKNSIEHHIKHLKEQKHLTASDTHKLHRYEEDLSILNRMDKEAQNTFTTYWYRLRYLRRFFDMLLGTVSVMLGLMIFTSLIISNIDKAAHSYGFSGGYLLEQVALFNPINYAMVFLEQYFPLDFFLYYAIVIFFIACTLSGIRNAGIWCFCVKLFKIRAHGSQPQALIILTGMLMYATLAIKIMMYELIPQYSTFGSQHYLNEINSTDFEITQCSFAAPKGACLMTRQSTFIIRYSFKTMVFQAFYYWISWMFLGMIFVGFILFFTSKIKSVIVEAVDPEDDFDLSDEDDNRPLIPRAAPEPARTPATTKHEEPPKSAPAKVVSTAEKKK